METIAERHVRPGAGQKKTSRPSDPSRASGHQRNSPLQTDHVGGLSLHFSANRGRLLEQRRGQDRPLSPGGRGVRAPTLPNGGADAPRQQKGPEGPSPRKLRRGKPPPP